MLDIKEQFETKEEAADWREQYLQWYHPCGYSTRLRDPELDPTTGLWVVTGKRAHSCD